VKRLVAIVILNIFLLNVLGYYGVLLGLKIKAGDDLAKRLDSDMYDLGATVTFQIPLAMPYGTDSKNYERVDGEFQKDGIVYRMVKQRYYQDVLYIVCVRDEKTTRINSALEDYVQSFAGQDDDNSQQHTSAPSLIKDYVDCHVALTPSVVGWEKEMTRASFARTFIDSYFASIVHPPDRSSRA
jgi:hypothetical protein